MEAPKRFSRGHRCALRRCTEREIIRQRLARPRKASPFIRAPNRVHRQPIPGGSHCVRTHCPLLLFRISAGTACRRLDPPSIRQSAGRNGQIPSRNPTSRYRQGWPQKLRLSLINEKKNTINITHAMMEHMIGRDLHLCARR